MKGALWISNSLHCFSFAVQSHSCINHGRRVKVPVGALYQLKEHFIHFWEHFIYLYVFHTYQLHGCPELYCLEKWSLPSVPKFCLFGCFKNTKSRTWPCACIVARLFLWWGISSQKYHLGLALEGIETLELILNSFLWLWLFYVYCAIAQCPDM